MQKLHPHLQALLDRLSKIARDDYGIHPEEAKLAEEIQRTKDPAAIPVLLGYLKHPNKKVRELAAYTLRDMAGLNASHLEALIEADLRGTNWLPVAIARIGIPQAVSHLKERLRRDMDADSQVALAINLLGNRTITALCEILSSARPEANLELWEVIPVLFGRLDTERKKRASAPLWEIVSNTRIAFPQRKSALLALGRLEGYAQRYIPAIQRLSGPEPEFADAVNRTLLALGVSEAAPEFVKKLKATTSSFEKVTALRDIARSGVAARAAGPAILSCLKENPWEIYWAVVRALGCIDYREAIPVLIPLLKQPEDWRIAWAAAEALGRLRATSALPELNFIATKHWYPPVREAAQQAIRHLTSRSPYPALPAERATFAQYFFLYGNAAYKKDRQRETPIDKCGSTLALIEGQLVAKDKGEWGGELAFINKAGEKRLLVSGNIKAIAALGDEIFAIRGVGHLIHNDGWLYRVVRDASGTWGASLWRTLPGAPEWALVHQGGKEPLLRIGCLGGIVDVTLEGAMRFVEG